MKKQMHILYIIIIAALLYIIIIAALLCCIKGCTRESIPSKQEIYEHFEENRDDILLVANYLIEKKCEDCWISSPDQPMFVDFSHVPIDSKIKDAVTRLMNNGVVTIEKISEKNLVEFMWWKSVHEEDCGLAYAIDNEQEPIIDFCTELTPYQEVGWYYYAVDYNKWRVEQSNNE